MKQRTSKPKGNKYYIRMVSGGLNGAVQGYPVCKDANVLCNCVGYANGRFNEIINNPDMTGLYKSFKYQLVSHAENFIERAKQQGLEISKEPTLGGIMVWQKGPTLDDSDGCGHVEIVEELISTNEVKTSGSAYGVYDFKVLTRKNDNGRWDMGSAFTYRGCVVNPSIGHVVAKPKATAKTEKRYIEIISYRNVYDTISKNKKIMQLPEGSLVYTTKRQGKWLYIDSLKGWICETDSKIGMCVKTVKSSAKKYITSRACPARSIPVKGSKKNTDLIKGFKFKGRELVNGYMYAEKLGWVTAKWQKLDK